jgi:hypothetical protein
LNVLSDQNEHLKISKLKLTESFWVESRRKQVLTNGRIAHLTIVILKTVTLFWLNANSIAWTKAHLIALEKTAIFSGPANIKHISIVNYSVH